MRYLMRERILSWGDDFTINDADGHRRSMSTAGSSASATSSRSKTGQGNEVALIDQKLLSLGPQYEIIRGGRSSRS